MFDQRVLISHDLLFDILKAGAPTGTRKKRADGHWYVKTSSGDWEREKQKRSAKKEDEKSSKKPAKERKGEKTSYRVLPGGKVVHVPKEFDDRKKAAKNPEKYKYQVVHADDESISTVNHEGRVRTHKHRPTDFLTKEDIYNKLNSIVTIDDEFALNYLRGAMNISNYGEFLDDMVDMYKKHAKENGIENIVNNRKDAEKLFLKQEGRPFLKKIQKELGEVTTWAKLGVEFPTLLDTFQKENTDVSHKFKVMSHMAARHAEGAVQHAEDQLAQVKKAKEARPEDMKPIVGISDKISFFGHQAETLAALNELDKAIVDVDMGGGKGLILPADAMNLMSQGKVSKPLIVVPGATLEQNARKIHEYTDNGMNVFMISNQTVRDVYDGDMEAMIKDIDDAPPNTIFMASYDVFSYKPPKSGKEDPDEEEYPRAAALGSAGFDMISLDESHSIKNIKSGRFKAMQHMANIPIKRVASGTFLSNNPRDVLGQMMFLYPHTAMGEAEFMKRYGFEETKEGTKWDVGKMKQLREDLQNIGMISLRRSAWMDKLPKRNEIPRIVKMDKKHSAVNDLVVNEVVDLMEDEMRKDPRLESLLEGDDFDTDDMPANVLGPLNLLSAITDYPDEIARALEKDIKTFKQSKESGDEVDDAELASLEAIKKRVSQLSPAARKGILSLKGTVSPKALDAYEKMREHLKDPKNGKFMVFTQRKMAASHVMDNMPEDLKKHAVYYDASKKAELESFIKDPKGPKILVAVDASIKEGVNMQVANAQYRYDHHYSPGNQEQGYARIWRFGQDKPANIYLGLVDGGVDVTKYARLMTKLHTNQLVTSNMEDDETFTAYKLNLRNIRNARSADILPEYFDMNKKILDFQMGENKKLAKKYGTKTWNRSKPGVIGGKDAEEKHGQGAYLDDIDWSRDQTLNGQEKDELLKHYRTRVTEKFKDNAFNREQEIRLLPVANELIERHKGRKKTSLHDKTVEEVRENAKDVYGDDYNEDEFNAMVDVAENYLKGKKTKDHTEHDPSNAVVGYLHMKGMGDRENDKALIKNLNSDVGELRKWMKKNKTTLKHIGKGEVENKEDVEKFWKEYDKKLGEKTSDKHRKAVNGIASIIDETHGGYQAVKHHHEDEEV